MPRTYIRKKALPAYTAEDVQHAVNDIQNKNCTFREAEEKYGVPISVIFHRIKGRKVPIERIGAGRPPVLNSDIEKQISTCLIARARIGYPCDKQELKQLVSEYVKINDIPNPFNNNLPGEDWYQSFMRRNSNISLKKPEHLQKSRKSARDPAIVYDFYLKLENLYEKHNLNSEDKARYVFNCDESGFSSDPSRLRALGEKGKALSRVSGGSGRESTTVLICVSADGFFLPPLIVFKGAAVQARWTSTDVYPGTQYAASSNGWIEEPIFFSWLKNSFVPQVKSIREKYDSEQTAVLLYDGHASHYSIRIIEEAIKNKIELVRFPAHLTDRIQPLDKCVFGPIKVKWDKKLVQYGKTQVGEGNGRLSKQQFGVFLGEVLREALLSKNIVSGFVSTGTYPVDSSKFSVDLFDPADYQRYKSRLNLASIGCTNNIQKNNSTVSLINMPSTSTTSREYIEDYISTAAPITIQPHQTPVRNIISESETEQLSPEVQNVALDLSTGIVAQPPPKPGNENPKTVVEIFSSVLLKQKESKKTELQKNPSVVRRLKQFSQGEVLTSEEVLERLKEAEDKKASQKSSSSKKKNKKTEIESNAKKVKTQQKRKKIQYITVDTSEDETEEQYRVQMDIESTREIDYELVCDETNLKPGRFILVDFVGGFRNKTHYTYLCVVNAISDNKEYSVTGMKSVNNINTEFIIIEKDISTISLQSIKAVLPKPEIQTRDRKLIYVFSGSVSVQEKR